MTLGKWWIALVVVTGCSSSADSTNVTEEGYVRSGQCTFCESPPAPSPGEVMITEVMFEPLFDAHMTQMHDWFEVHNLASTPRLLSGMWLYDSVGHAEQVGPSIVLAGGAYGLFVHDTATALWDGIPSSAILFQYACLDVWNGNSLTLALPNGTTVARSVFSTSPKSTYDLGRSVQLSTLTSWAALTPADWCVSQTLFGVGNRGTPGTAADCY